MQSLDSIFWILQINKNYYFRSERQIYFSSNTLYNNTYITYTVSIKERCPVDLNVKRAETPLQLGMRQKLIIPSCLPWKVVTFFGKEHVNWSSISGVMIGRSWTIKFGKCKFWVPKHQFWVFQNQFFNLFLW